MRTLRWLLLPAFALACGSEPKTPSSGSYRVVDATEPYLAFVDALPDLPIERRITVFHEKVIAAHPALFSPFVIGMDPTMPVSALDARLATYLPTLTERASTMHRLAREIHTTLEAQDASFRRAFPDMAWHGTIYLTASLDAFDGAVRPVEDAGGAEERALLFGIDKIAKLYGSDARIGPLFHHELFHCYHLDKNPTLQPTQDSHGMLEPLWAEGLAVYVAKRLNPDATNRELTLSDEMIRERTRSWRRSRARSARSSTTRARRPTAISSSAQASGPICRSASPTTSASASRPRSPLGTAAISTRWRS